MGWSRVRVAGAAVVLVTGCSRLNPAFSDEVDGSSSSPVSIGSEPPGDTSTSHGGTSRGDEESTSDGTGKGDSTSEAVTATTGGSGTTEWNSSSSTSSPLTSGTTGGVETSGTTAAQTCDVAGADPCIACLSAACCRPLEVCMGDTDCACIAECIGGGVGLAQCNETCGIVDAPGLDELLTCAMEQCPDGDECPNAVG